MQMPEPPQILQVTAMPGRSVAREGVVSGCRVSGSVAGFAGFAGFAGTLQSWRERTSNRHFSAIRRSKKKKNLGSLYEKQQPGY
jgi:hypothetical protein